MEKNHKFIQDRKKSMCGFFFLTHDFFSLSDTNILLLLPVGWTKRLFVRSIQTRDSAFSRLTTGCVFSTVSPKNPDKYT